MELQAVVNPGASGMISDDLLTAIVRQAFGSDARVLQATSLGGGQVNDTVLLTLANGERGVLRIAPSEMAASSAPGWLTPYGLRREQAVIAAAPDLADLLPVTMALDFGHTVIDRDWVIQAVMPGLPLPSVEGALDADTRADIWRQVGAFARRLHGHVGERFGPPSWGPGFERWPELVAWDAAGMVEDAGRLGLPVREFERLSETVSRLADVLDEVTTPSLIHSDLWSPHVFVAAEEGGYRLSGVIDLEFGRYADAASEHLMPTFDWGNVPTGMTAAFTEGYGGYEPRPNDGIRNRIYLAIGLAWSATLLGYQGAAVDAEMSQLVAALDVLDRER